MKKTMWLCVAVMIAVAGPLAWAEGMLGKGANELAIAGDLDFATEMGTRLELRGSYAYYFWDRIGLGVQGALFNNDAMHQYGIGATAEYNFRLPAQYKPLFGTDLVPYLGGSVCYRHSRLFRESESAVVFGGEAGLKFFLTDMTAVTLSLIGELATEDIYADDLEATNKDLVLNVGMRFYY